MIYLCCDEHRREAVRHQHLVNGIDFLEVLETPKQRQQVLKVHFVQPLKTHAFSKDNVRITGGERIRDVAVISVAVDDQPNVLAVAVNKPGDHSTYTLRVEPGYSGLRLDPLLSEVNFIFRPTGMNDLDCTPAVTCLPEPLPTPEIDYLAKDFASFRQLMLDRLSFLMPQWKERSAADIGILLVEIMAYVGDHLSYQQDAIATESYLSTARRRVSVRRHARLLDYCISEGCNARVWVQVRVDADMVRPPDDNGKEAPLPKGTRLLTKVIGQEETLLPDGSLAIAQALNAGPEVFETMHEVDGLYKEHNEMYFYTWGAHECCLPKGSTRATLRGSLPHLKAGDILIFQEVLGAHTGREEDAEPSHRHAVRLTSVRPGKDPIGASPWLSWPGEASAAERPTTSLLIEDVQVSVREEDRVTETVTTFVGEEPVARETYVVEESRVEEDAHTTQEERIEDGGISEETILEDAYREDIEEEQTTEEAYIIAGDEVIEIERSVDTTHIVEEERLLTEEPDYAIDITEIEWHFEDALPIPFCISTTTDYEHGHLYLEHVSVALGNIVLADHGQTLPTEDVAPVPPITTYWTPPANGDRCEERQSVPVRPRFHPSLKRAPLTHRSPFDGSDSFRSAHATMQCSAHTAEPVIQLTAKNAKAQPGKGPAQTQGARSSTSWQARRDLLKSGPTAPHFVVECESDGTAYLRFGDDRHGLRPEPGTIFMATYRVGNGVRGNIGAQALFHIVSADTRICGVCNPLPAKGGVEPESIEDVRQNVARGFIKQDRGVTPVDYKDIAERHPEVHRANAILRWTGSWYTVFVAVERVDQMPVDEAFRREMRRYLEGFRMTGSDIVVVGPTYVPLEIEMQVTVKINYFRQSVRDALLEVFSNRQWPDGQRGIFYPDKDTFGKFGQPVYLYRLVAAAAAVPGVASFDVKEFRRQGIPGSGLEDHRLPMGWSEIARLDNDPHYPEHGVFRLKVEGGK